MTFGGCNLPPTCSIKTNYTLYSLWNPQKDTSMKSKTAGLLLLLGLLAPLGGCEVGEDDEGGEGGEGGEQGSKMEEPRAAEKVSEAVNVVEPLSPSFLKQPNIL